VLAYVAWHVWQTKIWSLQAAAAGQPDFFVRMQDLLAAPWVLALYVVGVAAAVYHFANGMWNFCITWGVTLTRASQQRAVWLWALVGLVLFVLGVSSLLSFNGRWPSSPGI
jgi:succinate dehydrogenase / fumarate reductase cytochrome b subunit